MSSHEDLPDDRDKHDEPEHWRAESPVITLTRLVEQMRRVEDDVRFIRSRMRTEYITHAEFDPIQKIVYGMVGIILIGFLTVVANMVLRTPLK